MKKEKNEKKEIKTNIEKGKGKEMKNKIKMKQKQKSKRKNRERALFWPGQIQAVTKGGCAFGRQLSIVALNRNHR